MVEQEEASPERFGRNPFSFRQGVQTNGSGSDPHSEQSENPWTKEETNMNALPAILSILAAAAAVTLAITAFANA
jgi:hypothetical protein